MTFRWWVEVAALAACVALAGWPAGSGALADPATAAAPASDAERIAGLLFDTFYTHDQTEKLGASFSAAFPPSWPPAWSRLMADAVWEEAQAERPDIERKLSRIFTAQFTPDELAAGVTFLSAMASLPPDQRATVTPPAAREIAATPAGHAFLIKLKSIDFDTAARGELGRWEPGVFRRFGEKAEAAATVTPEDDTARLRDQVACALLPSDRMRNGMKPALLDGLRGLFHDTGHPEWDAMFQQAIAEEVDASAARYCAKLGPWIGDGLTAEEAGATLAFLKTPEGAVLKQVLAATVSKQPPPKMSEATSMRLARFEASPAGRKIGANLSNGGKAGAQAGEAYATSIVPGVFRRFGEKAQSAGAGARPGA